MSETPNAPDSAGIPEMSALFKGPKGDKGEQGAQGDQGNQGNQGFPGPESKLAQAAEEQVERLIKAKSTPKWWGRILAAVCLVILVFGGIGAWNIHRIDGIAQQVNHGAYSSCLAGNTARAANVAIWEDFIGILLVGDKNVNDKAHVEGTAFENYLKAHEKPQNCATLYPNQAAQAAAAE